MSLTQDGTAYTNVILAFFHTRGRTGVVSSVIVVANR